MSREEPPRLQRRVNDQAISLAKEWRALGRAATVVGILTSPALYVLLHNSYGWSVPWALLATAAGIVIFRGAVDVVAHRFIPSPALYGAEAALKQEDVVSRRRLWYWRHKFRVWFWIGLLLLIVLGGIAYAHNESIIDALGTIGDNIPNLLTQGVTLFFTFFVLFFINFFILFGPLVGMGIQQIKTYEPGDAN